MGGGRSRRTARRGGRRPGRKEDHGEEGDAAPGEQRGKAPSHGRLNRRGRTRGRPLARPFSAGKRLNSSCPGGRAGRSGAGTVQDGAAAAGGALAGRPFGFSTFTGGAFDSE